MTKLKLPKRTVRKSGWTLIGRGTGRDYCSAVSPCGREVQTFLTVARTLTFIRKREKFPFLKKRY